MTDLQTQPATPRFAPSPADESASDGPSWLLAAGLGVLLLLAASLVTFVALNDSGSSSQTADFGGQGGSETVFARDASTLFRRADGISVAIEVPTPTPGSYDYPTGDMIPPWAEPHPTVSPGASGAPEVFTVWVFTFNDPQACTDQDCDVDDLAPDAPARGGAYQLDGRVAVDDVINFAGTIRLGQEPSDGSPLDNPEGAEVHLAIAPHGRVLSGPDGWRQLNGPVGNPEFWWVSTFAAVPE